MQVARMFIFLFFIFLFAAALQPVSAQVLPLSTAEKKQVIDSISKKLNDLYIFPEVAVKMNQALADNWSKGKYKGITDPYEFATVLGSDLVAASHDQHMNVVFDPAWVSANHQVVSPADSIAAEDKQVQTARLSNYGFNQIRLLGGNIGYLQLTSFSDIEHGGKTAEAAMAFLGNADALIIDVRDNGGGMDVGGLLLRYLLGAESKSLTRNYTRKGMVPQDSTMLQISGKYMTDAPLYILIDRNSFSAAEAFAYLLQSHHRATIIGEKSGGGANMISRQIVGDRFELAISVERPVDVITGTNWEGRGVIPDIATTGNNALFTAQITALNTLKIRNPKMRNTYEWELAGLKARLQLSPISMVDATTYAGTYGLRKIIYQHDKLFYQRDGEEPVEMVAMERDLFLLTGIDYLRLHIIRENGKVSALERLYIDGTSRKDVRR